MAQQAKAIQEDEDDCFALAEETDLNDEDLDEHANRMMSIRALNINTLHRFSPGFNKRTDKSDVSVSSVLRKTLLSRASDMIVHKANTAVERHSKLRLSKVQPKPTSPVFKPVKEEA